MNAPVNHADLVRHYAEVRARLRQAPVRVTPAPIAACVPCAADQHVRAWREHNNSMLRVLAGQSASVIKRQVSLKYSLSVEAICGPCRSADLQPARRELAYRLRKETTMSLSAIGRMMNGRDHTSILWAIRQHIANSGTSAA